MTDPSGSEPTTDVTTTDASADAAPVPPKKRSMLLPVLLGILVVAAVAIVLYVFVFNKEDEQAARVPSVGMGDGGPLGGPAGGDGFGTPPPGFGRPAPMGAQPGGEEEEPMPQAVAGVSVTARSQAKDTAKPGAYYPRFAFRSRTDPFALLPVEVQADREQSRKQLMEAIGGFQVFATPTPKPTPERLIPPEPQPYRRLAGIVRGDAIAAILESHNDTGIDISVVKPGDTVKDTAGNTWIVRSIDDEKLVLYRTGNVKPNEVVVRLESRPSVMASGGTGGGAATGGAGGGGLAGGATGGRYGPGGIGPGVGPGRVPGGGGRGGGGPEY